MKKILIISFLLVAAIGATFAQTWSVNGSIGKDGFLFYEGKTTDIASGTTALTKDFVVQRQGMALYDYLIQVAVDTNAVTGDNPNLTVQIYGSNDDETYYTIGSSQNCAGSADTTLKFTTLGTGTMVNASHTETTAAATDYQRGFLDGVDSLGSSGVGDYLKDDTITVAQRVNTVAAQTTTLTSSGQMYRFIRVSLTGDAAGASWDLDHIAIAIANKND